MPGEKFLKGLKICRQKLNTENQGQKTKRKNQGAKTRQKSGNCK
jgi:hypothetical protein